MKGTLLFRQHFFQIFHYGFQDHQMPFQQTKTSTHVEGFDMGSHGESKGCQLDGASYMGSDGSHSYYMTWSCLKCSS